MTKLSVIFLSYAVNDDVYKMNCNAINSLLQSESWNDGELEVLLMESCKSSNYEYLQKEVNVLVPGERFNFHRFFNIGLDHSKGEFIAFCNNDVFFESGWFSAMMKVKANHPRFMCFSPLDDKYPGMTAETLPREKAYYCGWNYGKYFAPWCFVYERKVFKTIGRFDERFDFYAADADETNTLRYYAIPSVVITGSVVRHLSSQTVSKERRINDHRITDYEKYPLTEAELKRGYQWLWDDDRFYWGYQREKAKWGNIQMTYRVQRFFEKFPFLNIRPISKILYNRKVNHVLCKLTGIKE